MPKNTRPVVKTLTAIAQNTEASYEFPENVQRLRFNMRETDTALRFAFETGKVATPTEPYMTLAAGGVFDQGNLDLPGGTTLYVAHGAAAAKNVEILYWTGKARES